MRTSIAAALSFAAVLGCGSSPSTTQKTTTENPATAGGPAAPGTGKGRVETHAFSSAALGVDKDYVVYLPAGYDADTTTRYPVFYYLNGLTGDETNWTEAGGLGDAADAMKLRA